jgi:hypothetical protein
MPSSLDYSIFENSKKQNINTDPHNTPNYSYRRTRKQPKRSSNLIDEKRKMKTYMLEGMANDSDSDDNDDYNTLEPPQISSNNDKYITKDNFNNLQSERQNDINKYLNNYKPPSGIINPPNNIQKSSQVTESMTNPVKNPNEYIPYYNNTTNTSNTDSNILEKMNYMIELLEEQREERTGHVNEELILYSFVGVFMIFVVDSFSKNGKYVR